MKLLQVIVEAFRSMAANRLRTALTMLGIVIGIASVVLMLALSDTMQRFIAKELQALGTNMVYVFPGGDRTQAERMRSGAAPSLTLAEVDAVFAELASLTGAGSARRRVERLRHLLSCATEPEQDFLVRLLFGELRQGALEAVLVDAVARAAGVPAARVRRAAMLAGDLAPVAAAVRNGGEAALDARVPLVGAAVLVGHHADQLVTAQLRLE